VACTQAALKHQQIAHVGADTSLAPASPCAMSWDSQAHKLMHRELDLFPLTQKWPALQTPFIHDLHRRTMVAMVLAEWPVCRLWKMGALARLGPGNILQTCLGLPRLAPRAHIYHYYVCAVSLFSSAKLLLRHGVVRGADLQSTSLHPCRDLPGRSRYKLLDNSLVRFAHAFI
jgi:hypothetical protein